MGGTGLAALDRFDRLSLLDGATPIQRLERLERALGPAAEGVRLFVKRDDLMGIGGGGNKLRKLEFLMGAALAQQADTFITTGGIQSNHGRLSAAVSARLGLACELVLTRVVPRDDTEYRRNGNILLDGLFGATIHELPGSADALAVAEARAAELRRQGRRPYVVGSGGSSPVGCLGYAACAREIAAQQAAVAPGGFARIIVPNGSAGTHAGLAAGFAALGLDPALVHSFTVLAPEAAARSRTLDLARATLALLSDTASLEPDAIRVAGDQLGDGYGLPTDAMFEAVRLIARTEGLLLDPVYSGKAFAGLLAAVRAGAFRPGDAVLFVMTGGTPGLFAYRCAFDPDA
ncbi:D-cysteine desulfhydrase [Aliidongia dinghuensis]|uniref:D-cysteine desulfhydrase n=1 Tax=Aliidongia dinghuensis TaxID=1867774 RepID=A0A8J3E341_9PROT|nr:D-cysteine desulfhydrase family protein [Aliidongia dinghuensis]GGF15469.1 D-cysteine desulfhydrase [Aliidongia dinghuensis]